MTIFTPSVLITLFKAGTLLSSTGTLAPVAPVVTAPAVVEAPAVADPVRKPPRQVAAPEKVEIKPAVVTPQDRPVEATPIRQDLRAEAPREQDPVVEAAPEPTEPVTVAEPTMSADEIVTNVKAALAKVETAQGRFEQIGPDGTVVTGTYAIQRPGRVRFDYDDPTPLLIVSDRTTVAFIDSELETTERVPLINTPLNVILSNDPNFDDRAKVTSARASGDLAAVTVVDPAGEYDGQLTLIFDTRDWSLLRWETVDGLGAITTVILTETKTGVKLDPRLFRIEDVRDQRERDDRR